MNKQKIKFPIIVKPFFFMLLTGMLLSVEAKAQEVELLPMPGAIGTNYTGSPIVYDSALYVWYKSIIPGREIVTSR